MKHFLLVFLLFIIVVAHAQVGIGTVTPAASAELDVSSTSKGFLPPRLSTAQRDAIATPATGLVIFNTTTNSIETKNSSGWVTLSSSFVALPTIVIGTQQWQANNLDVAFYRNGDPIPQVTDATAWAALTTGAWCYYNNDSTLGTKYGKLYNWYAVNDARGLAPLGWHIPTDAEWTTLTTTLGGSSVAGGRMKEAGTLNWTTPNAGGNNNSGFSGLPGGTRDRTGGLFLNVTSSIWLWSSTQSNTADAWCRFITSSNDGLFRNFINKGSGFSVRCLRD